MAIGVAYLGMAAARELWLACAIAAVGGLGNGIQWVSVMTALQEATPKQLQARIVGLLESVASIMTGVGFLIGGLITAAASPPTAFAVAGAGIVLLVAVGGAAALIWPLSASAAADRVPVAPEEPLVDGAHALDASDGSHGPQPLRAGDHGT